MRRTSATALATIGFVTFSAAPVTQAADPFTLIVVPDTQNYTDFQNINDQYNLGQMRWIRDNMTNLNIKFVMHLGDHQNPGNPYRTQAGNIYEPDTSRPTGNVQDKIDGWNRANAAINVLDNNNIPYSLVPGNHDYLDHNSKTEPYLYLKTFGPQRYINEQSTWAPEKRTYGGASPASPTFAWEGMNTYHRFDAGGYKFLNIALQYAPDVNDLKWAQQIINENPGLPTIITTHAFVNTGSGYQHPDVFNKFIKNNPQILMSFNGHLTGTNRIVETNIAGHSVQQMLVDYQSVQLDAQLGGDYYRGGGVLHTVEVDPDDDRVRIRAYSPIADVTLPNNFQAPDNDGDMHNFKASSFGFDLDLEARFGLPDKAGTTLAKSFREGASGYTGNVDTFIDQNATAQNYGTQPTAWVDGDRNGATAGNPDAQGLIRFNNLIGAGAIPAGAMIESAELVLHTSTAADSQSPDTIGIYRLLTGWTETGATWNSLGGLPADGIDALLAANASVVPDVQGGFVTFDVTESLQTWAAGATNHGWVLLPGGNNGWQWDTADHANVNFRPQLNVVYRVPTVVPEPTSLAAIAVAAGALALVRRRRALCGRAL